MGIDYMEIGASPSDEDCAQLGSDNYDKLSRIELNAYVHQLERMFPYVKNSDSLKFAAKRFNHDFGTYAEVVIYFDTANDFEYNCAIDIEHNLPMNWDKEAREEIKNKLNNQNEKDKS